MLKITFYTSLHSISNRVDTKYTFTLDTNNINNVDFKYVTGKKEFITTDSNKVHKDTINSVDQDILEDAFTNLILLDKLEDAFTQEKKSVTISSVKNASKKFKEHLLDINNYLNIELSKIKEIIVKENDLNATDYDRYTALSNRINKCKFFKDNITDAEYILLNNKIAISKQLLQEFKEQNAPAVTIEQNKDTKVYRFNYNLYAHSKLQHKERNFINKDFYLVTNKATHYTTVIKYITKLIESTLNIKLNTQDINYINDNTFKCPCNTMQFTQKENNATIYKLLNNKLIKVV